MAIKLNHCMEMTKNEFLQSVINNNQKLKEAFAKNPNYDYNPVLPKPDSIYEREFHFMEETLLQKEQRIERRRQRKLLKQQQKTDSETQQQPNDISKG